SARGEDRAVQAAELAISSPLLEASIEGAHGVLLSIQGGSDLGLFEINEAARLVQEAAHPEANIIFGAVIDDSLGDEVRVTVIAAGFDGGAPHARGEERGLGQIQPGGASTRPQQAPAQTQQSGQSQPQAAQTRPQQAPVQPQQSQPAPAQAAPVGRPDQDAQPQRPAQAPPRQVTFEDDGDDLDVPDFLK
ncbi:MAG: cell division protein FtsZ, partial [Ornithinimicrobium sp.]|nr:cell division protein FtsZ [Ornithinimicrobium sp.]